MSLQTRSRVVAAERYAELVNGLARERLGLEVRDRNPLRLTVAAAARLHLDGPAARQAQAERLRWTLAKHIERDPIGEIMLDDVTRGVVADWLDRREQQGASAATCNRLRANLSAIFRALIDRDRYLGDNPIKRVPPRKTKAPKGKAFPWHFVPMLIEHAPSTEWGLRFILAAYTGARAGEIRDARWEHVDLQARTLRLERTKTGAARVVPLHRVVAQALEAVRKPRGLICSAAGWQKAGVRVTAALMRAGVPELEANRCTFHGLRGVWASRMIDCGADPWIVELIGWGARGTMARHYARPTLALTDAIDVLTYEPAEVLRIAGHAQNKHSGGK